MSCSKDYESGHTQIQCIRCEGTARNCRSCNGSGYIAVRECPMKYVGNKMIEAANLATFCKSGVFPVAGGLLDQAAWFVAFVQKLKAETSKIEAEQLKRAKRG